MTEWQLVPKEPDEKMRRAAIDVCPMRMEVREHGLTRTGRKSTLDDEECAAIYAAMLAAAPSRENNNPPYTLTEEEIATAFFAAMWRIPREGVQVSDDALRGARAVLALIRTGEQ